MATRIPIRLAAKPSMRSFPPNQPLIPRALCLSVLAVAALADVAPTAGLAQESRPWTLGETDCQIGSSNWSVDPSVDEFHSAPESVQIHFKTSWGTRVLVSQRQKPAWVIDELKPSVWIKGTRPKIQLMARIVLPHTEDPVETGPMTVLLPGPTYQTAGRWQKLDFSSLPHTLPELLEEEVWKLRAKFDQRVEVQGAYLDRLVLNLYTGPGVSTVWIDDVELPGAVHPNGHAAANPEVIQTVGYMQESTEPAQRPALSQVNGTILEVRGQPFFVRSIQHNGEPFEVLRDLGFNTIELRETATVQQLRHAERLDMWIVCPVPESAGFQPVSAEFDRVLAWSMGDGLRAEDRDRIKTRIREIRQSDFRENRPTIAFADRGMFELARAADILGVGRQPFGGSFLLSRYSDWLRQRSALAQNNLPMWAAIQTEMPAKLNRQVAAMASRVPPMPLEANQMKFMVYEAIAGGARGLRFLSHSRLDAGDPLANLRSLTLRWLNAHLRQLEPWASGGAVVNRTESRDRSQQLTTLATSRAKLILIQRTTQREQLVAGESPVSDFRFSDPSLTPSEGVYHLSESGMIPLDQGRVMTGNEITVENCGALEAVIITQDSLVINRMAESYLLNGQQTLAQMHLQIARQWMTIVQLINDQLNRVGQNNPAASGAINEANNALRQAQALINSGSPMTANQWLLVSDQKLAVARRNILNAARQPFASSNASPLLTHISLVPLHYELVDRIDPEAWQPNGLAGGDFENLNHMTESGWKNQRADDPNTQTHVELTGQTAVRGQRALLMRVNPASSANPDSLVDSPPLWIESAPVPVKAGQLVRIHGWVRVDQPITGSLDGLMIFDSIAGSTFAERISATEGWQEFSLYRCPARDTDLRLTLALSGFGEALVDEVKIRVIDLDHSVRQARSQEDQ